MAWWNYFSEKAEWDRAIAKAKKSIDHKAFEQFISEPVVSIVKAMISDRKRFVFQEKIDSDSYWEIRKYSVIDMDTEEEFSAWVQIIYSSSAGERKYYGPSWASYYEVRWAIDTISEHYEKLQARANLIKTARERNRLIEIYA